MGHKTVLKWDKSNIAVPKNHLTSSDFSRYGPPQWKFMDGEPDMVHLMANDYQRMWQAERDVMVQRNAIEVVSEKIDFVKRYVQKVKNFRRPPKPEKKEPFKIKKFKNAAPTFSTHRPPDDKAMSYLNNPPPTLIGVKQTNLKTLKRVESKTSLLSDIIPVKPEKNPLKAEKNSLKAENPSSKAEITSSKAEKPTESKADA